MKTVSKVGIIVWSVVALLLVGVMIAGICLGPEFVTNRLVFYSGSALNNENTKVLSEYSVATKDVEEINLDWESGLIRINTYSGDDIKLTERVPQNSTNSDKMTYNVESGKLEVKSNSKIKWHFLSFGHEQKVLDVEIPENNPELLTSFIIKATSADISVNGLEVETFNIDVTSGDITIDEVKADNCYISATSGNITINNIETYKDKNNTLQVDCTSGNIKLYDSTVKDIQLDTTSGNATCDNVTASGSVQISCSSGNIETSNINATDLDLSTTSGEISVDGEIYGADISATSGDITVKSTVLLKEANFSTTSGNINLYIPDDEDKGFTATYDANSGDFDSELEIMSSNKDSKLTYGNGEYSYSFKSSSGDLTINRNREVA